MIVLLRKAVSGLLKAALAPFVSLTRGAMAGGPVTWGLHVLLLSITLIGLWRLNGWMELDKLVHAPSRFLRELWLPLLFMLSYALAWAGLWTWWALSAPQAASPFPDIDQSWRQAMNALRRRGVDPIKKPLVVLLGQPTGREADLLSALELTPTFGPVPSAGDAPLRVLADDDALYLLCHDVSLASACSEGIEQERLTRRFQRNRNTLLSVAEREIPVGLRAGAQSVVASEEANTADGGSQPTESVATVEREEETELSFSSEPESYDDSEPTRSLFTTDEADRHAGRLEHLMRLVRAEREPTTPIDGVALLTPCDAAQHDRSAHAMGLAIEQDLAVISTFSGVRCPVLSVVTDVQHTPGCGHLLHSLTQQRRRRRLGVELPYGANDTQEAMRVALDDLTKHVTPSLCQRLMRVDQEGDDVEPAIHDNAALFEFQHEISQRGSRIADVLSHGVSADSNAAWPLLGCYLVATGDPLSGSQAFGGGVLSVLHENRRAAWTEEALAQESKLNRNVAIGYTGLTAAAAILIGLFLV